MKLRFPFPMDKDVDINYALIIFRIGGNYDIAFFSAIARMVLPTSLHFDSSIMEFIASYEGS